MSAAAKAFKALRNDESALRGVLDLGLADAESVHRDSRESLALIAETARDEMVHWSLSEGLPDGVEENLAYFMLVFTSHYVAAMEVLVTRKDDRLSRALSVHLETLEALETRASVTRADRVQAVSSSVMAQAWVAEVAHLVMTGWLAISILRHAGRRDATGEYWPVHATAVSQVVLLYEMERVLSDSPLLSRLAGSVASPTAAALIDALQADNGLAENVATIGYHALNTMDLARLAERDARLKAKYGMSVERAFERQLSLLLTSFGYAVIESVPGQRQVDLLCVAGSPEPASFVVEAKTTSSKPYTFPATHERALTEHVGEVRRTLRGLPPLKLILVVAPSFSPGAATRLQAVGKRCGVGCFGMPAYMLAMLRLQHMGDVPFDILFDEISAGPAIVQEEVVARIIRIARSGNEGLQQLVAIQRRARVRP